MIKLTDKDFQSTFTVVGGRIVWNKRDAAFYKDRFARAFDPENAAMYWGKRFAGKPPHWRFDKKISDYVCKALLRVVTLKQVTAALGVPYAEALEKVDADTKREKEEAAKEAVRMTVELRDGVPHWKIRTSADFPKTAAAKLVEFNSRFAGCEIRPRSDGLYRVRFHAVSKEQLEKWLK